ncbi:MAG TPA: hypothetical protein VGL13_11210, partial [Polyangiaceae bacterium]
MSSEPKNDAADRSTSPPPLPGDQKSSRSLRAAPPPISPFRPPQAPAELERGLARARYLADPGVVLSTWLAIRLERPLLIEGPAGVGKT